MKLSYIFLVCLIISSQINQAQNIKIISGDFGFVKTTKTFKVIYNFANMRVGKLGEDDYLNERFKALDRREPGLGGRFKESWFRDREFKYPQKFEEQFNEIGQKFGLIVSRSSGEVQMEVQTTFTQPGQNSDNLKSPASIDLNISFSQNGKELAKLSASSIHGQSIGTSDSDTGTRIADAYGKAGKALAQFLSKYVK